jgi:integrase
VSDWAEFKASSEKLAEALPLWKLKQMVRIFSQERRKRTNHQSPRRCINKSFGEDELARFFRALTTEKQRLLFLLQLTLALRISEAVSLNRSQINFERQTITIYEGKTEATIEKKVPALLFLRLTQFIDSNRREIEKHEGRIFFLSPDYARNLFRRTCIKAKLNNSYGESRHGHKLHVFSTHSLRHTGISRMSEALKGDIFKLKIYSGHKSVSSLQQYVHNNRKQIYKVVDEVFD